MANRLVLFDIDGTLIHGGPVWRESFQKAFLSVYPGREIKWTTANGKTDGQIATEMIEATGGPTEDLLTEVRLVIDRYLEVAQAESVVRAKEVQVLPGVHEVLDECAQRDQIYLGLLTGNIRAGAVLKLQCAGLNERFDFGVYCDHHFDRYQLPAIAVELAYQKWETRFTGQEVVIIGDTVHDVLCGKSIGARSIAVGTGRGVNRDELLAAGPDAFFENLEDVDRVLGAVMGSA
jgi:phosphoglycolate phosphatase-like HAD superfamily hydrolase